MASSPEPEFIRIQRAFGRYLRDPDPGEVPAGVEPRRMGVYRRLVRSNIQRALTRGFPVLREAIGEVAFDGMLSAFMAEHAAAEPVYRSLAGEFVAYLWQHPERIPGTAPWAAELADYEWQELVVSRRSSDRPDGVRPDGDLISGHPVLNPTAVVREYRWPVHRIAADWLPAEAPATPTVLVIFRRRTGRIGFHRLSPLLGTLLRVIAEEPGLRTEAVLEEVARASGLDARIVIDEARPALETLREAGIILGSRDTA